MNMHETGMQLNCRNHWTDAITKHMKINEHDENPMENTLKYKAAMKSNEHEWTGNANQ